jgi:hypothetical protein
MIIKKIQDGGVNKSTKKSKKSQPFDAMGLGYAADQKKQEMEMKKQSENEIDLGYTGSFTGMKCSELENISDRLDCNYDKYKFDDPLAKTEIKRKKMQLKRTGRHKSAIQRICAEEDPYLCSKKDREDLDKEKDEKCMDVEACQ